MDESRIIALATLAGVATSAAWYAVLTPPQEGADGPPPAAVLPVELARTATVATAVAVLARRTGVRGPGEAVRLGLGLWAAFPAVLLSGSVFHERVPWQRAAVHAGDWLVKLTVVSLVVGRRGYVPPRSGETVGLRLRRLP